MKSIVIGSGFGGISAALRLRAKGHEVTLIEKQNDLGGRARIFRKNGFSFDAGPTVITAPYLIYELFELFGKDPKDYLNIKPLNIWYQFVFEDGTKFNYSGNEEEMEKQISAISPDDVKGYIKLVNFTKKIFEKGYLELSDVPFTKPFFMMKQIPSLLKLKSYKSVYSLVSSYIKHEKLRRILSMHPLLVGGNPFTTTSIYGLILYLEKKWGIHYSMGGTGNIIKGLETLMNEENIKIKKGFEVNKIISNGKTIKGIRLENGDEISANNVVCNADPPDVYERLLNKKDLNFFSTLREKEWIIQWVYLFITLELKKFIRMSLTTQLSLATNTKNIWMIFLIKRNLTMILAIICIDLQQQIIRWHQMDAIVSMF